MASRHFSVKHGKVGRGKKHAQYIGGQGNYADKDDVVMLLDMNMPSWAVDGVAFFDAADKMERANGRTYTEFEFAIPRGIENPQAYAREFARIVLGKNHPYRLAVHDKLASDGGRNIHAHLMFTERKLDGINRDIEHFFLRANTKQPEKGGTGKDRWWHDRGMVESMRLEYSKFAKSHGIELDLRSNLAQGLVEPEPKIGPTHPRAQLNKKRGKRLAVVEDLRDRRLKDTQEISPEQKLKNEALISVRQRRKQLWADFQKQRRSNYAQLANELKVSASHEKEMLAQIKDDYLAKRNAIKSNNELKFVERRAAISIAHMQRITQQIELKARFEVTRQAIKVEQNEHYSEKYRLFLVNQVKEGDEVAQTVLTSLKPAKKNQSEETNSLIAVNFSTNKIEPTRLNLKYQISKTNEITYLMHGRSVLKDIGQRVDLLQTDDMTIETGLRLALAKFGSRLSLTGSQAFQARVASIAAEKGLRVEFVDPAINRIMLQHKEELAAQSEYRFIHHNLIAAGKKLQGINSLSSVDIKAIKTNYANLDVTSQYKKMIATEVQVSLSEAERIAKANGFETVRPSNKKYRGSILATTSHHVLQNIGQNKLVIHERGRFEGPDRLNTGEMVEFNYLSKSPKASVDLSHERQKPRTR